MSLDAWPESVLRSIKSIDWLPLRDVHRQSAPICIIEFDANAFDPLAFADAGIARPGTIGRSVLARQAEFFFGRLAARFSLTALGVAYQDIPIGPAREPIWPFPVVGSITHNQNFAAAVALTQCSSVGIDIESVVSPESQQALLATAVSLREQAYLRTLTADLSFDRLITAVFSAKESFFKAAYASVGRYFDFTAAEVVHFDTQNLHLCLEVKESLSREYFVGKLVRLQVDYIRPAIILTSLLEGAHASP